MYTFRIPSPQISIENFLEDKILEPVSAEQSKSTSALEMPISPSPSRQAAAAKDRAKGPLHKISLAEAREREACKSAETEFEKPEIQESEIQETEIQESKIQESKIQESQIQDIEQALAQLVGGDFHKRWDKAKQFVKRFQTELPVDSLIHHLQTSTDPDHQWFLVRILGQYNHPAVVETLARFLVTTPEVELQAEAIKALTKIGDDAIALLDQQLQSQALSQRRLAARTLAQIRRSAVVAPLLSVARDPDSQLRLIAVEALGSFHDPRITPVLISALTDEEAIALEAIRSLGRRSDLLADYDLVSLLQRILVGGPESVAKESAIALGRLGTEAAARVLGTFLMEPAPTVVKISAVRALSWLDSAIATMHLVNAFDCALPIVMPTVQQEIAKALGQTRSTANKLVAAKPLVHWLQKVCTGIGAKPRSAKPRSPEATQATFELKQTIISSITWLGATEATGSLILLLADDDLRIQMHALSALKQIDPRDSKASVMHYLESLELNSAIKPKISQHLSAWQ